MSQKPDIFFREMQQMAGLMQLKSQSQTPVHPPEIPQEKKPSDPASESPTKTKTQKPKWY